MFLTFLNLNIYMLYVLNFILIYLHEVDQYKIFKSTTDIFLIIFRKRRSKNWELIQKRIKKQPTE
jgi:hypothetical protein